jgi:hypothetical protein
MAGPRIWFDPPAFSWSRVLRIGTLWFALVLLLLMPLLMTVDEPSPSRAASAVEPAGTVAQPLPAPQPVGPTAASMPPAAVPARVASAPMLVASAAR